MSFVPTYLYIKQHTKTGLKYFGKTVRNESLMLKYKGSGTKWRNHINYHGKDDVVTLWYKLFDDENELRQFALNFSLENNIVESSEWANLIPEDGVGSPGNSDFTKKLWQDPEYIDKQAKASKTKYKKEGYSERRSELTKKQMSDPKQKEIVKRTFAKAHANIDHTSKEWTERSFNSQSSKEKSKAKAQSPESRERARQRELSKPKELRSEAARKRAEVAIANGIKKFGSEEAYKQHLSERIKGRVKVINLETKKVLCVKDTSALDDKWVAIKNLTPQQKKLLNLKS